MSSKTGKKTAARYVKRLALGKTNDAVKLLLLEPESLRDEVGQMDLSMVAEMKKGGKGEVEVKFFNRIALLELLARLMDDGDEDEDESGAESFFTAMDRAAARLGEDDEV